MPIDFRQTFDPYIERLRTDTGGFDLFDAHTHVGRNDPDGFKQEPDELLAVLEEAGARALTFPMHEPEGYDDGRANDEVIALQERSGGRVACLCRVDPNTGDAAVAEATRALDAGARGIKLHPRGERFTLSHPTVERLVALVHERGLPMLVHAGRGIPALGADTVRLSGAYRDASIILAHCAISDLAWIWRELPEHPNVYVDTSWWSPSDMLALFAYAPPGQVLFASDSPYGHPSQGAVQALRCAVQAGLSAEQVRAVAGGQLARILAGEAPADLGPAPGAETMRPLDPLLERVVVHLSAAGQLLFHGADHVESLALARLACDVRGDGRTARVCREVTHLIDRFETELAPPPEGRAFPDAALLLMTALFLARTPDVALPQA